MVLIAIDPNEQHYLPEVSIVIAARNCENALSDTLQNINELDYPKNKIEIIVVDDASTDNTAAVADVFDVVVIRRNSRGGCSGARNTGILNSSKNIIAFIDADCIVTKNWLHELVKPFKDENVWATGGYIKNKNQKDNYLSCFIDYDLQSRKRVKNTKSVPGSNSAFRRRVFNELGLLETDYEGGEDIDISYRIHKNGHKLIFNEKAIIYHPFPNDIFSYFNKGVQYAKTRTFIYLNNKEIILNDEHTPWSILIQPILLLSLFLFSALLYPTNKIMFPTVVLMICVFLFLELRLLSLIANNNSKILPASIIFIFLRIISWFIGMILGVTTWLLNILIQHTRNSS